MNKNLKGASVAISLCLLVAVHAAASDSNRGRVIFDSILRQYPGLTLYLQSGLMGENARLIAEVPRSKWTRMTAADKRALASYVQSELATVRSSPSRYSLTPTTAPIWPTHRAAFEQICDACWEIHVGTYDRKNRSLLDDWSIAIKGGAPRESAPRHMLHEANLRPLTATNAAIGVNLYNAAGGHEATIVAVDAAADRITVRYNNGVREPKTLSAVGRFWYVK